MFNDRWNAGAGWVGDCSIAAMVFAPVNLEGWNGVRTTETSAAALEIPLD